ncbi:MAG: TrkH family potassium uptake protein [Phycisphaerae bacterium]
MARINRNVLGYVGLLLHTAAAMGTVGLAVAAGFGQWPLLPGFGVVIIVAGAVGQLLWRLRDKDQSVRSGATMVSVAIAWMLLGILTAVPFLMAADSYESASHYADPFNAWFEAISGVTSTGLTITARPDLLPEGLQFWRSLLEWVGGAGLVLMVLALVEKVEDDYALYQAEARTRRIGDDVAQTVRSIWWIYLVFTAGAIGLMMLVGLGWWEAVNHGLTGIATGGFTIHGEGFAAYSTGPKLAMVAIMLLGAMSFSIHHSVLRRGNLRCLIAETQMKTFWIMLVAGTAGISAIVYLRGEGETWVDILFGWVSAMTTCGFSSTDHNEWPSGAIVLLIFAMFIGGAAGSTAGGAKLRRIGYLSKGIIWRMRSAWLTEDEHVTYRLDGKKIDEDEAVHRLHSAGVTLALFLLTLIVGTFALLLVLPQDVALSTALFESASALGSGGLSSGLTNAGLNWQAKLVLILLMWMGRLEIMSVFVLVAVPIRSTRLLTSRLVRLPFEYVEDDDNSDNRDADEPSVDSSTGVDSSDQTDRS